jgi:hypothetical protein
MGHRTFNKYRFLLLYPLLGVLATMNMRAGVVPPTSIIVSLGANHLFMKAMKDSAIQHFKIHSPGFYIKLSGEDYVSKRNFVHVDLNMSFNQGTIADGTVRATRLCFNYGFGRVYNRVKLILSPGFCYSTVGYHNNAINRSIDESRFAPSLGLQIDFALIKSRYRYLAIFIEGSAMIAKPSRWVQQVALGLNWKPSFKKEDKPIVLPY